jgi:hypothetical protein
LPGRVFVASEMTQTKGKRLHFKLRKIIFYGVLRINHPEIPDITLDIDDGRCYFIFRKTYIS